MFVKDWKVIAVTITEREIYITIPSEYSNSTGRKKKPHIKFDISIVYIITKSHYHDLLTKSSVVSLRKTRGVR